MASNLARTNQGGSVASFLVVGIVLVALVTGGIYFVQKRDDNRVVPAPVATTDKDKKQSPSASPAPTPKASPSKSAAPKPTPSAVPKKTPPAATQPLPVTGPTDNLSSAVILALLVGVSVSYVQSLRARTELVRK